jgi:hypothetical protein
MPTFLRDDQIEDQKIAAFGSAYKAAITRQILK